MVWEKQKLTPNVYLSQLPNIRFCSITLHCTSSTVERETVVEVEIMSTVECNVNSQDETVKCDTSQVTATPKIITVADILNIIMEGLESAVARNEEIQHDIAMNVSNGYKEMLSDTSELLQQLEENEYLKECYSPMEDDHPNSPIVSMECHSDSSSTTSSSSCIYLSDINCEIIDQPSLNKANQLPDLLPFDLADIFQCGGDLTEEDSFNPREYYSDWDEVMSSDEDLRSSNEPTTTDDIKEGLEASQEMNEEFYNDIATSVQIHAEEICNERNEILQRLENTEGAQQQCFTSMGEDSSPAIVSMECHSDSTSMTSLTSSSLTNVTDIDFDTDNQVCVTDTKRCDVVSWDEVMSSDEDLTRSNEPTTTDDIKEGLEASQEMKEEFYNDIATSVQIHTEESLNERNEVLQWLEDVEEASQQCSVSMGEDSSPAIVLMECHSDSTSMTSLTSSSLTNVTDIDFDNDNQVCVTDTKRRDVVSWDEVTSSDEDLTSSNEPTTTDIFNEIMEGLQDALEMNEEFYNDIATNVKIHTEEILNERNEILQRLEDIEGAKQQCSGEDGSPAIVSMECHSDSTPIPPSTSSSLTNVTDIVCATDTKRRDVVSWDEMMNSDEDLPRTSFSQPI
ncbi:uncharacterized protein [Dysidea avara]|uniref:uncharacterized protein n=1 Tax=Dysidea avara TaxID=196820 RepID=UPI003323B4AC